MKVFILTILYLISEPTESQKKLSGGYPYMVPQTVVHTDRDMCEHQAVSTSAIYQNRAIVLNACVEHNLHLKGEWGTVYPPVSPYIHH